MRGRRRREEEEVTRKVRRRRLPRGLVGVFLRLERDNIQVCNFRLMIWGGKK